jgi:hypothetical protein
MQPETTSQLRFYYGEATATELQTVADEVLNELGTPTSEAAKQARQANLNPEILSSAKIEIIEEQQGAEPILTTVLVGITIQVGSDIAKRLWDEVIWPRLRRRLGARAVGDEVK